MSATPILANKGFEIGFRPDIGRMKEFYLKVYVKVNSKFTFIIRAPDCTALAGKELRDDPEKL